MSEELENSLQQAIETYLNDRLRTIDEQLSRLQTEVNEALTQLRDKSRAENLAGTTLSAAIFAHLQTARGQKLTGAAFVASSREAGSLRRAIEEIERQSSQTELLKSLLSSAVHFAERVALFVVKNDQAIGWRLCRASDPTNQELIGGVSLPLNAETIVTRAANSKSSQAADIRSNSGNQLLVDQLGGEPQFATAVPLIVRGKVVAVLYADSSSADAQAISSDALEVLARVAAMAVNLASVHRAGPSAREGSAVTKPSESVAAPAPESTAEVESTYTPQIEPQVAEPVPEAIAEEQIPSDAAAPPAAEAISEHADAEKVGKQERQSEASAEPAIAEVSAPEVPVAPPAQPSAAPFLSEYAAPLGGARRFGVSEPELPIEVSEEERRLHNDARRFARLLVSEIKLYNEPKVKEGRSAGDLYDRLREDIDRSRQMYDKRVAPPVAARHDYFHQELVNTLAEGDPTRLGGNYPGAAGVN